jgi:hypothetical protein
MAATGSKYHLSTYAVKCLSSSMIRGRLISQGVLSSQVFPCSTSGFEIIDHFWTRGQGMRSAYVASLQLSFCICNNNLDLAVLIPKLVKEVKGVVLILRIRQSYIVNLLSTSSTLR